MSRVHISLALIERNGDVERRAVVSPDFSDDTRTNETIGEVILNYRAKTYQFIPGPRVIEASLVPPHLFLVLSFEQVMEFLAKNQLEYSAISHSAQIHRKAMARLNELRGWEREESVL